MADPFVAAVQYGDLRGTVALDGHSGSPLYELAAKTCMPGGFFPVGFSLRRLNPNDDGTIPFRIVAVQCDEVGKTMDEVIKYAQSHEEVPVYSFDGKLPLEEFSSLFKRFDMKVLTKNLRDANVVEYSSP